MTSTSSYYSQPLTRAYTVTQNSNNGEQGAYFYADSDFDNWVAANGSKIQKLGSVYIIPGTRSGSNFVDVLTGNNGATELDHTNSIITDRKALKDMGKQIIIGNGVESRLLIFRRVQRYISSTEGGALDTSLTGYVVTENNASDLQGNTGRFTVRVARV
jgi:hypothetical protein